MANNGKVDILIDKDIVEKFRNGEIKAFEKIFNKLYPVLCAFSNKYLRDSLESEDVTQELFVLAWNQREKFESIEQIKAFLYISAKNMCLNLIKHNNIKEKYKQTKFTEIELEDSFEKKLIRTEVIAHIKSSIDKLPGQRKKVILLGMNGLTNNEIAEELNISINTVKLHKKIAYESLKEELKDMFFLFL
jgi:RNA polymerase sigma-70 factor (ECF subfamily)